MNKVIYDGHYTGAYMGIKFTELMGRLNGELVGRADDWSKSNRPVWCQIWHIESYGITVRYTELDFRVTVTLFGKQKEISEIEKMILLEAEKRRNLNLVGKI